MFLARKALHEVRAIHGQPLPEFRQARGREQARGIDRDEVRIAHVAKAICERSPESFGQDVNQGATRPAELLELLGREHAERLGQQDAAG
jgi:hypothetical protein